MCLLTILTDAYSFSVLITVDMGAVMQNPLSEDHYIKHLNYCDKQKIFYGMHSRG